MMKFTPAPARRVHPRLQAEMDARQAGMSVHQAERSVRLAEIHADAPDFSQGCPQCKGQSFRVVRSSGVRAAKTITALSFPITGPFALLAFAGRKNRAECMTCGTQYTR